MLQNMALLPTARFVVKDYFYAAFVSIIKMVIMLATGNVILMPMKSACIVETANLKILLGPVLTHTGLFFIFIFPNLFFFCNICDRIILYYYKKISARK